MSAPKLFLTLFLIVTIVYTAFLTSVFLEVKEFRKHPTSDFIIEYFSDDWPHKIFARSLVLKSGTPAYHADVRKWIYAYATLSNAPWNLWMLESDVEKMNSDDYVDFLLNYPSPTSSSDRLISNLVAARSEDNYGLLIPILKDTLYGGNYRSIPIIDKMPGGMEIIKNWMNNKLIQEHNVFLFDSASQYLFRLPYCMPQKLLNLYWPDLAFNERRRLLYNIRLAVRSEVSIDYARSLYPWMMKQLEYDKEQLANDTTSLWRREYKDFRMLYYNILGGLALVEDFKSNILEYMEANVAELISENSYGYVEFFKYLPQEDILRVLEPTLIDSQSTGSRYRDFYIADVFDLVPEEIFLQWAKPLMKSTLFIDPDIMFQVLKRVPEDDVLSWADSLVNYAKTINPARILPILDYVCRRDLIKGEYLAERLLSGNDVKLGKGAIVVLIQNGSEKGEKLVDNIFRDTIPPMIPFSDHAYYLEGSTATNEYCRIARHGYLETGKTWPPSYVDGKPFPDETVQWRKFIDDYPWFPGTDDAYYRMASRHFVKGNSDSAFYSIEEFLNRDFLDDDARPNINYLLRVIAVKNINMSPTPPMLIHLKTLAANTISELALNLDSNSDSLLNSLEWFLTDSKRVELLNTDTLTLQLMQDIVLRFREVAPDERPMVLYNRLIEEWGYPNYYFIWGILYGKFYYPKLSDASLNKLRDLPRDDPYRKSIENVCEHFESQLELSARKRISNKRLSGLFAIVTIHHKLYKRRYHYKGHLSFSDSNWVPHLNSFKPVFEIVNKFRESDLNRLPPRQQQEFNTNYQQIILQPEDKL